MAYRISIFAKLALLFLLSWIFLKSNGVYSILVGRGWCIHAMICGAKGAVRGFGRILRGRRGGELFHIAGWEKPRLALARASPPVLVIFFYYR